MAATVCAGAIADTPVCVLGRATHSRRSAADRRRRPRPFGGLEAAWRRAAVHRGADRQGADRVEDRSLRRAVAARRAEAAGIHLPEAGVAARPRVRTAVEEKELSCTTTLHRQ